MQIIESVPALGCRHWALNEESLWPLKGFYRVCQGFQELNTFFIPESGRIVRKIDRDRPELSQRVTRMVSLQFLCIHICSDFLDFTTVRTSWTLQLLGPLGFLQLLGLHGHLHLLGLLGLLHLLGLLERHIC